MTPREKIQNELVQYLENNNYFSAPYGIIPGLEKSGKGKVRTIAFGVSRYFDGIIYIWSENNITVGGQGGLADKFCGKYSSIENLKSHFNKETNKN